MNRLQRLLTPPRLVFGLLMAVFLAAGLHLAADYGISWDEPIQVDIGIKNYRYVVHADPALLELKDRHYGPLFEMFLVRFMDQTSPRSMFISRHRLTFLAFWAGVIGFYLLLERVFPRRWLALFGAGLLVFSPRIFADAFYNSKDIPFMVAVIWAAAALQYYLKNPSFQRVLLAGLFSAVTTGIRLPGVFLVALTALMMGRDVLAGRLPLRRAAGHGLVYLLIFAGLTFLFYPVFWREPLTEIPQAFEIMANFPHFASVLYMGHFLSPQTLPWHYLPVWIGITTPIPCLLLILTGIGRAIWQWLHSPKSLLAVESTPLMLAALWLGLPLGAVAVRGAPMYDAWRQMFFIYPALLIFATAGWDWFSGTIRRRIGNNTLNLPLTVILAVVIFAPAALWMAAHHPYQNLYFNPLAGPDMQTVKMRFDMDYWGLTYRRGLEAILEHDQRPLINIYAANFPGEANAAILPPDQAGRLNFVQNIEEADYFITNYRWHPQDYPYNDEIFTLRLGNARVLSVFRLR